MSVENKRRWHDFNAQSIFCLRGGVTLLEVLLSMFILMIGLLGVGALIPIGRLEVGEGDKLDRAAAVGRSAFREIRARAMLRPDFGDGVNNSIPNWWYVSSLPPNSLSQNSNAANVSTTTPTNLASVCAYVPTSNGQPLALNFVQTTGLPNSPNPLPVAPLAFAIDPWGVSANALQQSSTLDVSSFPANAANASSTNYFGASYVQGGPYLHRITLRWVPFQGVLPPNPYMLTPAPTPAMQAYFNQTNPTFPGIFQCRDELLCPYLGPGSNGGLPNGPAAQQYYLNPNTGTSPPNLAPEYRQFDGNYSWMATVVPTGVSGNPPSSIAAASMPPSSAAPSISAANGEYIVSVVVFYKRVVSQLVNVAPSGSGVTMPSERTVLISFSGGAVGGGEATLISNVGASYLNVKRGQWILLSTTNTYSASSAPFNIFRWYRIVSTGDVISPGDSNASPVNATTSTNGLLWLRNVTLAGPDWQYPIPTPSTFSSSDQSATWQTGGTSPPFPLTFATLCDGVVAVYEKPMQLEGDTPWSTQ